MISYVPTLTDFILEQQNTHLVPLFLQIENAAKIISSQVTKAGLVDILGKTGKSNASHDQVQKMDIFANQLIMDVLFTTGEVYALASEETDALVFSPTKKGKYIVFFDPLDGSSNIDISLPIGTIFSLYEKQENLLQPGRKQIAAGYILYSTSTLFVLTLGKGVYGFTLDPSIGSFLLSHKDITIPPYTPIYSVNEANQQLFFPHTAAYINHLKKLGTYSARYVGTMVADLHRTLLKGGIFLYPEDKKHPEGKLRLLYEVNPFSFLIEQAGGKAISKNGNPLDILPIDIHQRTPIVIGSKKNVEEYQQF